MKLLDYRNSPKLPRNPANPYYWRRDESIISTIVIHHTAGNGDVFQVTAADLLRDWSSDGSGAYGPHTSYHYFISPEGIIYWCNYHWEIAWHAANANTFSIGVALQGNFEPWTDDNGLLHSNNPTPAQLEALQWLLVRHLPANGVKLGRDRVYGHGDPWLQQFGNNTACPGANMRQRVIGYRTKGVPFAMTTENETHVYFPETQHHLSLGFLVWWRENGGLQILGYPIGEEESGPAASEIQSQQWFERGRLEYHPANLDPYKIQLGLVGRECRALQERVKELEAELGAA